MGPRVLVIDNYDSFTYNLVQYLGELGATPVVKRNDDCGLEELRAFEPAALVVSPGPGRPEVAGISCAAIAAFGEGGIPVLGVCLGHQCVGVVYGARVIGAPEIMHGKTSLVHHDGKGVFADLANPFEATRYHSLVVEASSIPDDLEVSARTEDGIVMGLRHRHLPVEGVQFHPESIFTHVGRDLLSNFLGMAGTRALNGRRPASKMPNAQT